jgi:hypothetical protein
MDELSRHIGHNGWRFAGLVINQLHQVDNHPRPHKGLTDEESDLPGSADSGKKIFTFSREG